MKLKQELFHFLRKGKIWDTFKDEHQSYSCKKKFHLFSFSQKFLRDIISKGQKDNSKKKIKWIRLKEVVAVQGFEPRTLRI